MIAHRELHIGIPPDNKNNIKYFAEATFKPTVVVNIGTTTGIETTNGTVTDKVEGADKTEPTDKSENENDEDATETEEYKFPFEMTNGFSQDNPHHTLDLFGHMESAKNFAIENGYSKRLVLLRGK